MSCCRCSCYLSSPLQYLPPNYPLPILVISCTHRLARQNGMIFDADLSPCASPFAPSVVPIMHHLTPSTRSLNHVLLHIEGNREKYGLFGVSKQFSFSILITTHHWSLSHLVHTLPSTSCSLHRPPTSLITEPRRPTLTRR